MNQVLVNPLAAYVQGQSMAENAAEFKQARSLRDVNKRYGAGLATGDQNALAALAAVDPQAAMAFKREHLGMDATRQSMQIQRNQDARSEEHLRMARANAARAAQRYVAQLSAEQRAEQAGKLNRGLRGAAYFYSKGDKEGFEKFVEAQGLDPADVPFDQFPAVAAQYTGVLDTLQNFEVRENPPAPEPADEYQRYIQEESQAGRQPLSRIDYSLAKKGQGTTVYDPATGQPLVQIGGAGGPPKMTVDAAKNSGFLARMLESNEVLGQTEEQGTRWMQQQLENVPMGLGNYGRDPEFQRFDQARRDFVNAILRRESGAVISQSEFDNANKQYFPAPGDTPEVIEQKRRNRLTAIQGIRIGASSGAPYVDATRLPPYQPGSQDMSSPAPAAPDFSTMSDEELDAYIAANGG